MPDNLPAVRGGLLPSKLDRQLARALAQVEASTTLACRQDEARLDRVAGTPERGMMRAAQVGAMEATLIQNVPNAAGYVHREWVAELVDSEGKE